MDLLLSVYSFLKTSTAIKKEFMSTSLVKK